MKLKKIVYITPHLSTGGLPQYLLKKIETLIEKYDIYVIEHTNYSDEYIVQKNKIKSLVGSDHIYSLPENKEILLNILDSLNPDIVHFEEIPEHFLDDNITHKIYSKERKYFIVETSHTSTFNINQKKFLPDKFMHVSKFLYNEYSKFNIPSEIIEYPIVQRVFNKQATMKKLNFDPQYKHVLNVGLFTPGKNQKQIFDIARILNSEKIQFHFVGNLALNFKEYWQPLLVSDIPPNCIMHGEQSNIDDFYAASDLFLFTSIFELNPLVVKEALSYDLHVLMYNLDTYCGVYDNNPNVTFLTKNNYKNAELIIDLLFFKNKKVYITHTTKNYVETTFGLIYSLLQNSKYSIVIFTVNFDINEINNPFFKNYRVKFYRYDNSNISSEGKMIDAGYNTYVDRNDNSIFQILTLKPKILLEAFRLGITKGVYLDSDLICRYNIDDLMSYIPHVNTFPLLPRGVYDIMLDENGNGDIERPLMNYLSVTERSMEYVQSNIIVFSDNCINFINEWNDVCLDDNVVNNWKQWTPYHEETIINVLFWKYRNTQLLPTVFMNIRNMKFVEDFYKFDVTDLSKYSYHMQGFPYYINGVQMTFTYIPMDKNQVKAFHGIKSLNEIKEIIKYERDINE